jgi:hypothetical protein
MIRRWLPGSLLVLGLAAHGSLAQSPGCHPANPTRTEMINRFKTIVSATSPRSAEIRVALGIPLLPQDSVVAVTDSITCASLSAAQAAHYGDSAVSITAVKIGSTRYAVFDKGKKNGHFESVSLYDAQYTFVIVLNW